MHNQLQPVFEEWIERLAWLHLACAFKHDDENYIK
jgi:hypothetical protein